MIVEDRNDGRLTLKSRYEGGGEIIESNKQRRAREAAGNTTATGSETPGGDALAGAGVEGATVVPAVSAGFSSPVAPAGTTGTTR